ncbi:restriction endonuclease PLD domain-containing protein [uncultured Rothia sp.]|uniref:restriction endonuclease PLD domain-containing protein n=1 Tax=uncultured Rothia sp. TaxID=316088 RepID=UPI002631AF6E|nr:restriction endonuclease PLD domain-containing protein [uncultured Rothia sp.]
MEFYSSLMGDNLAELVLQSPYPKDDCAGHELWAVTGYISRTTILSALYQADFTPGRRSKESGHWGEMSKFTPTSSTPKVHLLVGMARDGAVSITTHEILKGWVTASHGYLDIRYPDPRVSPLVHTKLYAWAQNGSFDIAYAGSANLSTDGLNIGRDASECQQENILVPVSVEYAENYIDTLFGASLSCTDPVVDSLFTFPEAPSDVLANKSLPPVPPLPEPETEREERLKDFSSIKLYLYSHAGKGSSYNCGSGINWGLRDIRANKDEAYFAVPANIGQSNFFPMKNTPIVVHCDDGEDLIMRVASGSDRCGKDMSTIPNSELGSYIRKRMGLDEGTKVGIRELLDYGRTYVTITRTSEGNYYLDFSPETAEPDEFALQTPEIINEFSHEDD